MSREDDVAAAIAPDTLRCPAVVAKVEAAGKVEVVEELTRDESVAAEVTSGLLRRPDVASRRWATIFGLRLGGVGSRYSGCRDGGRSWTLRGWVVTVPGGCRRRLCGMWRACRSGARSIRGCG
ncbi:DUF6192 family protein [Streptomyces sp. NBC_00028]|uniref:DUF6192 family protein n=1 Tax=Streptomyces sp. NBC_00028 TaxID=2975624 RepID=UPI003250A09F